jgi:hypothetical protein
MINDGAHVLLTIAIPTFNRVKYLRQTLNLLIAQVLNEKKSLFEILVADNASNDGTDKLCSYYLTEYPGLFQYIRHSQNLGFDSNLDSLFMKARGEYVLLHSDDDYPNDGALRTLMRIINSESSKPALIYTYHQLINSETGLSVAQHEPFFIPPVGKIGQIVIYSSGIELLELVNTTLSGGLTGTVIKLTDWLKSERKQYIGTNFLHLAVGNQVAAIQSVCIVYSQLFVCRVGDTHRWPTNGEVYFGHHKAGRPLIEKFPKKIVERIRRQDWSVTKALVSYRCSAPKDTRLVDFIRDSLDKNRFSYWLIDLPLLVAPAIFYQIAGFLKTAIFRRTSFPANK